MLLLLNVIRSGGTTSSTSAIYGLLSFVVVGIVVASTHVAADAEAVISPLSGRPAADINDVRFVVGPEVDLEKDESNENNNIGAPPPQRRVSSGSVIYVSDLRSPETPQKLTKEQWQGRQRSRQRRLFMIQQELMASFGFKNRPNVSSYPRMSRDDVDEFVNNMNSSSSRDGRVDDSDRARLVHLLTPTCAIPQSQSVHFFTPPGGDAARSLKLFFSTAALRGGRAGGQRKRHRDVIQLESAILRLHWTGQLPPVAEHGAGATGGTRSRRTGVNSRRRVMTTAAAPSATHVPGGHVTSRRPWRVSRRRRPPYDDVTSQNTGVGSSGSRGFRVIVYQLMKPHRSVPDGRKLIKVLSVRATNNTANSVRINVRSAVMDWLKKPNKNYGLEIVVMGSEISNQLFDANRVFDGYNCSITDNGTRVFVPPSSISGHMIAGSASGRPRATATASPTLEVTVLQPILRTPAAAAAGTRQQRPVSKRKSTTPPAPFQRPADGSVAISNRRRSRHQRQTEEHREEVDGRLLGCRLHSMEVSFEEMGWDWVIEPKRFKAGYCEGPCSASTDLHESTATNGTEATQQANMKTECCQPTRTDPLYILYMDDTMAISYQRMDGMIITECGCQQSTKC